MISNLIFLVIFVLQEVLNNETTYSNGESHFFSKYPLMHNQIFHSNKHVLLVVIIELEVITSRISKEMENHLNLCYHWNH